MLEAFSKDEGALTTEDDTPHEERCVIIGFDSSGRLLVVVFTWRGKETVRLISARRATRSEADMYTEEQR
ncbi:MAG TPA: BrnT family toxin [Longimicrobium sp.]|nr:BrnT family toxin [Longimicrobium sp.]